jgi:DNA primase
LIRSLSLEERAWIAARQALNDLHFMASIIRKSSVQSEIYNLSSRVTRDDDLYFEENAQLLVKRDYPNARRSLQEQLGSSISIRRKRIYQRKLHEVKHQQRRQADQDNIRPPPRRGSTSASHPSPSQADAKPKPLALQMLKKANDEHNNSIDTRSRFDGTAARKRLKRSSSTSSSRGSTVRDSEIVYPDMPKFSKSDERCECPYCTKPLLVSQLRKDPEHWK